MRGSGVGEVDLLTGMLRPLRVFRRPGARALRTARAKLRRSKPSGRATDLAARGG